MKRCLSLQVKKVLLFCFSPVPGLSFTIHCTMARCRQAELASSMPSPGLPGRSSRAYPPKVPSGLNRISDLTKGRCETSVPSDVRNSYPRADGLVFHTSLSREVSS